MLILTVSIITLSINPSYTGGSLSVKAVSACGISSSTKSVSLTYLPPTPTSITSSTGSYNPCIRDVVQYTVVCPAASTSQSPMVKLITGFVLEISLICCEILMISEPNNIISYV